MGPADGRSPAAENGGPHEESEAAVEAPAVRTAEPRAQAPASGVPAPAVTGTPADGLRSFREILAAAQVRRWPMYLRNVKQMVRQGSPSFDERAFGFANLSDLLRAAHKEGVVRVERDRQGVIRVFQGNGASVPTSAPPRDDHPVVDAEDMPTVQVEMPDVEMPDERPMPVAAAAAEIGVPVVAGLDSSAGDEVSVTGATSDAAGDAAPKRRRRSRSASSARPRARKPRPA